MADIPGNIDKMDDVEIAANAPVTETLMNKIGANINALIDLSPYINSQTFNTNGTFNVPEGVNSVLVIATGGGAGGGGHNQGAGSAGNGTNGADTLFGAVTAKGGLGGGRSDQGFAIELRNHGGGSGKNNTNVFAQPGNRSAQFSGGAAGTGGGGGGGEGGYFGAGGNGGTGFSAGAAAGANSGAGGGGGSDTLGGGQGGGAAPVLITPVSVTPLAAISVTIGAGGAGGTASGGSSRPGGAGGSGKMIVFY